MFMWDINLWDVMPCRLVHSWAALPWTWTNNGLLTLAHRLHGIMRRDSQGSKVNDYQLE